MFIMLIRLLCFCMNINKFWLIFQNKQEDEKSVIQVDVDQVESYRSSADEVESAATVSWICNGDSTKEVTVCKQISPELKKCATAASSGSISGDDKTAERIAYTWKMGEDSSSKDIRGESLLFSISSDGHRHSNDAADITGPGGMEVGKENTVVDTDGFGNELCISISFLLFAHKRVVKFRD